MATTPHLGMTLIDQNQAQKEVSVNLALMQIDALMNAGIEDKDLSTPPTSPAAGAIYLVGPSPTGAWAGKAGQVTWFDQVWRFLMPKEGLTLWVNDEDSRYTFTGTVWTNSPASSFSNLTGVGIGVVPDTTNRLSVVSDAVLFDSPTAGTQIKVNKMTSAATGSYLFQTGYSGRAEFGLIGSDDFSLKVSPDGTTFRQALVVDQTTGNLDVKQQLSASGSVFRRMITLRPGSLKPSVSGGCADVAYISMGSSFPDIATLNFDASVVESGQITLPMPKNWNEGTVTAQLLWSHGSTTTNFGVVWTVAAVAAGDLDSMAVAFGTAVSVTDTGGTADTLYFSPETSAITVAGSPADGDALFIKISRNATHASDTLAIDARLHAVRLFYTQSGFGDE